MVAAWAGSWRRKIRREGSGGWKSEGVRRERARRKGVREGVSEGGRRELDEDGLRKVEGRSWRRQAEEGALTSGRDTKLPTVGITNPCSSSTATTPKPRPAAGGSLGGYFPITSDPGHNENFPLTS